jgi:hypothetical protein
MTTVLGDKWSRKRGTLGPVPFFVTLLFMSAMGTYSYRQAIEEVKKSLGKTFGWEKGPPTPSALCQARRKMPAQNCYDAVQDIMSCSRQAQKYPEYTCRGFKRILAVDGTFVPLPSGKKLMNHFGARQNQNGPAKVPTAGIVALWNIGANQPIGWDIQGADMNERAGMTRLLHYLKQGDLLIADRGYPGLTLFHAIQAQGADYLIRMNTTSVAKTREFEEFLQSSRTDQIVTYEPRAATRGKRRWDGEVCMKVRYIKSVSKKYGTQVWATSLLDNKAFNITKLKTLYERRWKIETAFFESKQWHGLSSIRAQFVDGVHQEIAVIFLFMWMTAELEAEARVRYFKELKAGKIKDAPAVKRMKDITDVPYRFNRLEVGAQLINLIETAIYEPGKLKAQWKQSLFSIWRYRSKVRKRRSYVRESKNPHGKTNLRGRSRKNGAS